MTEPLTFRLRHMFSCACKEPAEAAVHIEKLEAALREITWIATPDHEEARHKATEIARKALDAK